MRKQMWSKKFVGQAFQKICIYCKQRIGTYDAQLHKLSTEIFSGAYAEAPQYKLESFGMCARKVLSETSKILCEPTL